MKIAMYLLLLVSLPACSQNNNESHDHEAQPQPAVRSEAEHADADHAQDGHDDHDGENHDDENHDSTRIDATIAADSGIRTQLAGPGSIERHSRVYGQLVIPPERIAQVQARYPGVITAVHVSTGDEVSRGQLLAVVEANDSLQRYDVRAPIDGRVLSQFIRRGDLTSGPLFTLLDNREIWAELRLFPSARNGIQQGQTVHIIHNGHRHESHINQLLPGHNGQPYVSARAALSNDKNAAFFADLQAGDIVTADIDTERADVPLVIDNRALQELEGQPVVFVRQGDEFSARQIRLGRRDEQFSEVLAGLTAGEQYVVENSYLIKADIGKAGAAHEH